jgi:hypothetical protein
VTQKRIRKGLDLVEKQVMKKGLAFLESEDKMAEAHDEEATPRSAEKAYVLSSELFTGDRALIKIDIPLNYDFDKRGKDLLARIKGAMSFYEP